MITIIVILLTLCALGAIVWVVVRKLPQLSSLTLEVSPKEQWKQLKKHLVVERAARRLRMLGKKLIAPKTRERASRLLQESYQKLKDVEEKYRVRTSEAKVDLLLKRGRNALGDDPDSAEQCFLETITLDPRNLEAYEGLFHIYLKKQSFSEAQEVREFLSKLNPAGAGRYLFELATTLLQSEDRRGAWQYGTQALAFEPGNPKYLDFCLELAILEGHKREANKYMENLKAVNPENGKIPDFEKRISELEN